MKRKGVPIGYKEFWKYRGRWKEKKVAPRRWKFTFEATKGRKAKSYGGLGKGTTGRWLIKGIQSIKKIGKGKYQTRLTAYKYLSKIKTPKRRY